MIVFPNAKINLGLRILRKRSDGYHDLETVFHPIALYDVLEMVRPVEPGDAGFTISGNTIEGEKADNLCLKAYDLLSRDFSQLPALTIQLHKSIPTGAGLGGGSADAAFALTLLNHLFKLDLDEETLTRYALQLGSDCPFFIINQPAFAHGRGERLERIALDLGAYYFIVVNPGIHVNTREAFSRITPSVPDKSVKEIVRQPIATWKNELINDFEDSVFKEYTIIGAIKEQLYHAGAVYASMSGSGSTVFGLFEKGTTPLLNFPENYFVKYLPGKA